VFGSLSPKLLIGTKGAARRPSAPRVLAVLRAATRRVTGGGAHYLGVPVVVLTHQPPTDLRYPGAENFSFVTDGIEAAAALAQQVAGEKNVCVAAGTVARQCLEAGLLDEASYLRITHGRRLTRRHSLVFPVRKE
jgi:dihydrofolate reductase